MSVAVNRTLSVKFVARLPNASRAVTTIGNGVPAITCCGPVDVIDVTAAAATRDAALRAGRAEERCR